eukprot:scaffold102879_cov64-Phaeocystis_antarctica.AAC.2
MHTARRREAAAAAPGGSVVAVVAPLEALEQLIAELHQPDVQQRGRRRQQWRRHALLRRVGAVGVRGRGRQRGRRLALRWR